MKDQSMDNLKEMICRELDEISEKGELSAGDLDMVYKLAVAKEKLLKAESLEEEMGYSSYGGPYYRDDGMSRDGRDMSRDMGGDSYGRHYVRGHYSRDGRMRR